MNGFLDAIVGGWSVDGVGRIQTGEMLDFGNVRLVGMTQKDLQKEIKVQQGPGRTDLHPAGRHPRQHREGVQRQRDVGERLRLGRCADRPLLRSGERSGLHRDGARPTATAVCAA